VTTTTTSTPTNTPTNTQTPTNSLCKTYLLFGGTTNQTTFAGIDCDGFAYDFFLDVFQTDTICAQTVIIVDGDGFATYLGGCPLPTPTATPTNTATNTPTPSNTSTNTPTPTQTPTVTPTNTETPTNTPTNTTTNTETPTNTPTNTETPTNTPTQTNTPTVTSSVTIGLTPTPTPTNSRIAFTVYYGLTSNDACDEVNSSETIYGDTTQFDLCQQFWNVPNGNSTVDMSGYYQNNGYVLQLDSNGVPIGFGSLCSTQTPTPTNTLTQTPTLTQTSTPTQTPTNTETTTPTPTQTPTNTPSSTTSSLMTITMVESGGNIVVSGEGEFNLSSLTYSGSPDVYASIVPTGTTILADSGAWTVDVYTGITSGPSSIGTNGLISFPSSFGTDSFGIGFGFTGIVVPQGYTSGVISSVNVYNSATFASKGYTPGTYTWTWGSGTLIIQIG
jgi:hypothetical protein